MNDADECLEIIAGRTTVAFWNATGMVMIMIISMPVVREKGGKKVILQ